MKRRSVIIGLFLPITTAIAGCSNIGNGGDDELVTNNASESNDTDEPNTKSDNVTEPRTESEDTDRSGMDDEIEEAGTSIIQVHARVIETIPEDEDAISSNDERLDGVILFTEIFEKLEKASEEMGEDELTGEEFSSEADNETEKGREATDAKSKLPLTERTIEGSEENGIYVEYQNHALFLYFREFNRD